ncbi:proline-rich nuclear receptor coactivator 2-like [Diabrotica virgifera virgifera]|uniref:Proline-rich nuclear receptor coactivator 2-like isoform X1 n=1 Tax=Diabrotica virgifera virgifera TaxID=50390 RepID=A0A6P7G1N8_DIAVI|nr:proline-rich nuclear receptor coactivator 2-like [Diabrotica virgifera virgifera]
MAMATKHSEGGRIVGITSRALRYPSKTNQQQGVLQKGTPRRGESSIQRLNASTRGHSPNGSSPRTSPGLVAGHYAGCKFSEPPLPSALPLPPKHWMQTARPSRLTFYPTIPVASDHKDVAQQLKMLLKVQA